MASLLVMIEEMPDRHWIQGLAETHSPGWRWPDQETPAHTVWSGPYVCRMEKTEWRVQNILPRMWDWSVTLKPLRDGESPRPLSSLTSRQSRKNFYKGLASCSLFTWDSCCYYCFLNVEFKNRDERGYLFLAHPPQAQRIIAWAWVQCLSWHLCGTVLSIVGGYGCQEVNLTTTLEVCSPGWKCSQGRMDERQVSSLTPALPPGRDWTSIPLPA